MREEKGSPSSISITLEFVKPVLKRTQSRTTLRSKSAKPITGWSQHGRGLTPFGQRWIRLVRPIGLLWHVLARVTPLPPNLRTRRHR